MTLATAASPTAFQNPGYRAPIATKPATSARLCADDAALLNGLAAFHLRYGKPVDALALAQTVHRCAPTDDQSLRLMAEAFVQLGEWDKADQALASLDALNVDAEAQRKIGVLHSMVALGRRQLDRAQSLFRSALAILPGRIRPTAGRAGEEMRP
ncbi:MAG: tetratricopeptide repeat protein [Pseudomonadota bacterium]